MDVDNSAAPPRFVVQEAVFATVDLVRRLEHDVHFNVAEEKPTFDGLKVVGVGYGRTGTVS